MLTTHPNPRLALMLVVLLGSLSGALAQERDTDVPALLENGNYYLSQGNCPLAQYFYQEALKLETENDLALVGKGRALACQGALADAVSSFEDAIDSNAENVSAYVQVALTYERQHRSDPENYPNRLGEALDVLAQAERIAPDSPQVLNTKGIILYSLGNLEDARTTLERASTLAGAGNSVLSRSEQSRVQVNLGRVYRDLDQLEQARNAFRRAVVFDPTSTSAHNNLGNIHFRLGNCADAEYELAQASTLSPNSLSAVSQLAIAMFECDSVAASLPHFERAVELEGAVLTPPLYTYLARVYLQVGRIDDAVRRAQQGALLPPESAEAHYHLGQAYQSRGASDDVDAARQEYQRALELNPAFSEAEQALGSLP